MKQLSTLLVVLAFASPFGGVSSVRADACEAPTGGVPGPVCMDTSDPSTPLGGGGGGGAPCTYVMSPYCGTPPPTTPPCPGTPWFPPAPCEIPGSGR